MKQDEKCERKAGQGAMPPSRTCLSSHALLRVNTFRVHLVDMYHTVTGPWWDTEGRAEGQILHHIEIPLSGHRQVVHGQNVLDLMAGHVYFLPGNTPVAGRHIEDAETIWVRFRCEWLPGVDPLMDWPERTPCILDSTDTSTWRKWHRPRVPDAGPNCRRCCLWPKCSDCWRRWSQAML